MAAGGDSPDKDQKTELPTERRLTKARQDGDVLQSKELGAALVMLGGAAWIALAGPWTMQALENMLRQALTIDIGAVENFTPGQAAAEILFALFWPFTALFAITLLAAIGTPALLGSLGFRASAFAFKGNRLNPLSGLKRIFGMQGLIELGKSLLKVVLLGAVGVWLLASNKAELLSLGRADLRAGLGELGWIFIVSMLVMAMALAAIALVDVPTQMFQRTSRLKMTKQEIKDEMKENEGSPEVKSALRQRQHELLKGGARKAMGEATMVLTNPTHFAVALRYRPGFDQAPIVVARGRGPMAEAIRELASEVNVPMLSYPELTRAIYYTSRAGQIIREDLFLAVATVLAFVFNLDRALAEGIEQPAVNIPGDARFDENGVRL
jgi:flagellar biosynthesis protein FlhB